MNVKAEDIKLSYGAEAILKGVSMEAGNREFVGLIGPNGSGKSTLLKCVYRVLSPDKGAVFLDGKPLKDMNYKTSARSLGVVAQHNYYNFDFSVREVVLMGRSPHKKALERDNAEDYAIVAEALKTVGMAEFANRSFSTLSGGEQQMLAMGRALMSKPSIILMDEPSMGLSPLYVSEIFDIIQEINKSGTTVLLVEQNAKKALSIANRAYVLETGKIVLSGDAHELMNNDSVKKAYLGE